uniref:JmjC domain-containing protein n=1 Tax=Meloidogyne hapla TaxID=6305 RepID=A0A1I8B1W0_MELHA
MRNDFNNDELFYLLKENNCTIERVDGAKLSQEDFLTNYAYSKPLIITNVFDNARKSYFLKSNLLRDWGDSPVVLASANTYREIWKPLLDEYKLPAWNLPGHEAALSFGIAAVGTGVPFHFHGPGFAEVIFGAKYWFLSPFEKRPKWDPNVSTLQWMKEIFVNLPVKEKPLECLLLPGELIYFPDKWWHCTLNVRTSAFFSTFLSPTNIGSNKGIKNSEL